MNPSEIQNPKVYLIIFHLHPQNISVTKNLNVIGSLLISSLSLRCLGHFEQKNRHRDSENRGVAFLALICSFASRAWSSASETCCCSARSVKVANVFIVTPRHASKQRVEESARLPGGMVCLVLYNEAPPSPPAGPSCPSLSSAASCVPFPLSLMLEVPLSLRPNDA